MTWSGDQLDSILTVNSSTPKRRLPDLRSGLRGNDCRDCAYECRFGALGERRASGTNGNRCDVSRAEYEPSIATGVNGNQYDTSAPGAGAVYVYALP